MSQRIYQKGDGVEKLFDGRMIRKLRKSRGLTAQNLADKVDITQSYISRFENNKAVPNIDILQTILRALGSDVSSFYAGYSNLNSDMQEWINVGNSLSEKEREAILHMLRELRNSEFN
ncbi:helix-turn-helix domain-containing protein [Bacillus sp. Marseille-P3800]|uniref:helix-turn-helix domain-containing protein n=1 Tax=Bacillus sp. Marseille-P3800 TaxID=2014782 RepID=UPI000C073A94|nr:helix-turn-helix transcriptional regulator [Bacillus sp. Marseille-P3800]